MTGQQAYATPWRVLFFFKSSLHEYVLIGFKSLRDSHKYFGFEGFDRALDLTIL